VVYFCFGFKHFQTSFTSLSQIDYRNLKIRNITLRVVCKFQTKSNLNPQNIYIFNLIRFGGFIVEGEEVLYNSLFIQMLVQFCICPIKEMNDQKGTRTEVNLMSFRARD